MKRVALLLLVACWFGGCAYAIPYHLGFALANPEPAPPDSMKWQDDKIEISFSASSRRVKFDLKNKTPETIKIIWDEATMVVGGKAQKVIHSGVRYAERNESHPPAIIPPGASISDAAMPAENIYYREGWEEGSMFPTEGKNTRESKAAMQGLKGQRFGLHLPIEFQGKIARYVFEFRVTDVVKIPYPENE